MRDCGAGDLGVDATAMQSRAGCSPYSSSASALSGGRSMRGCTNRFRRQVLLAMSYANWCEHGAAVIANVWKERPADYLKIVASNLLRKCMSENVASRIWGDEELFSTVDLLRGAKAAYGKHQGVAFAKPAATASHALHPRSAHWREVKAAGSRRLRSRLPVTTPP